MCYNQYFKFTLVIIFIFNDVYSWNYYRSYRHIDGPKACTFIKCKDDERCVNRKFWCKYPPCPNMIYCSKTQKESIRGPSSCDTVQCSKGHICVVKVRHCKWNEPCREELARCITEMEYYNGPASCAGYKCPAGHGCILREKFCPRPPCKLLRSCSTKKDQNISLRKCEALGCLSPHECFLRRPTNICESPSCKHTPDCIAKTTEELTAIHEKCRGWICPHDEICEAEVEESCDEFDCKVFRTCINELVNINNHSTQSNKKINVQNSSKSLIHLRTKLPEISDSNINNTNYIGVTTKKSFNDNNSTLSSLTMLINYLQNKTGIETIKYWVQKAEQTNDHTGFQQWLQSVKELLGIEAYGYWLDEIRDITSSSKAFQHWLTLFNISKSSASNQSSASQDNINTSWKGTSFNWTLSRGNDLRKNIYNTQSLMNPLYQQQNNVFPNANTLRVIPYLFEPGNRRDANSDRHYGYYILPPIHYSSDNDEHIPQTSSETNQQEMLRQFVDDSDNDDDIKRASLVDLLQKLKEERLLYQEVINKTQELVAKAKPLLPPLHLDEIMKKLQDNKSQLNNINWNTLATQRILPIELKNIDNENSSVTIDTIPKTAIDSKNDFSTNHDPEYFLINYDDPTELNTDINQTQSRILIKVENNLNSATKLGEIGVKYDDDQSMINSSYYQHSKNNNGHNNDEDY